MKQHLLLAASLAGLACGFGFSGSAHAQAVSAQVVTTCGSGVTYTAGYPYPITQNTAGQQCSSGTGGGGGGGAVYGPTAVGAAVANPPIMNGFQDGSGNVAIVKPTAGLPNTPVPSSLSSAGIAATVTGSAAACQVLKASAGNLYSASGYASAASYIMVFNATSAPADGAVTPVAVAYAPAAGSWSISYGPLPLYLSTGGTVCTSSTGPYTKTAFSTSNFITGQMQ